MTSMDDGFNYPAHLIPSLEQFIGTMKGQLPIAEDTWSRSQQLIHSSAGETFVQFEISMGQLVRDLRAHIAAAEAFVKAAIEAALMMHATDKRGASLFPTGR